MSKRQHAVQFSTVAKVLLVSLFLGGSGVGYVLQKGQIRSLRMEKTRNGRQIGKLVDDQRRVDVKLSESTNPSMINEYLKHHGIVLRERDLMTIRTVHEPRISSKQSPVAIAQNRGE